MENLLTFENFKVTVGSLKQKLKEFGFKQEETETTSGAYKIWMKISEPIDWEKLLEFIKKTYPVKLYKDPDFGGTEIFGDDFKIQSKGKNNIFVSITRRRPKGFEYKMGLDI